MKNIVFSISLVAAICASFNTETAPNFELFNKSDKPIGIIIRELGYAPTEKHIQPQQQFSRDINIAKAQYLSIFENINPGQRLESTLASRKDFKIDAQGKKTVYLSWNPSKAPYLYPQTGPWMGLKGTTESGLPLDSKTNIEQNQIQKTN